jgi:hypothetical protein
VEEPVKPETARGLRRLLPRRKRTKRTDGGGAGERAGSLTDPGFDPVEFAEFLEADHGPLPVDPAFKERLRKQLWAMVREQAEPAPPRPPGRRPPRPDS